MKRAFTLTEVLAVIAIATTFAAISYPVFSQVRRSARKSECISNLHQIGVAISMYRSQYDGVEAGTPVEMGLPPGETLFSTVTDGLKCHGTASMGEWPLYSKTWPEPGDDQASQKFWAAFVNRYGSSTVMMFDANHQPSAGPVSVGWQNWTVLGLKLDTSVYAKTHRAFPLTLSWWTQ